MIDEVATCVVTSHPKARKEHKCCECLGTIAKDETYSVETGICGGEPFRYKTCADCEALRAKYNAPLHWEEGAHWTGLLECIADSDDVELMREMIAIKRKRGGKVPEWMTRMVEEVPS